MKPMDDLTALIARLEAAPEGTRELDCAICIAVWRSMEVSAGDIGLIDTPADELVTLVLVPNSEYAGLVKEVAPCFTTSLDAKLPGEEAGYWAINGPWRGRWLARCSDRTLATSGIGFEAEAATEPLARRAAALRAIQHERERVA